MKYSIRRQLALVFMALILGISALCLFANTFFLEDFYVLNKKNDLISNYRKMEARLRDTSDYNKIKDDAIALLANSGISVILTNSSGKVLMAASGNDDLLKNQFYDAVLLSKNPEYVLERKNEYMLMKLIDSNIDSEYLVVWGPANDGNFLMLKTTLQSIQENVKLSNTFMLYITIAGAIISSVIIMYVSKKITNPILELASLSVKMTNLEFESKYVVKGKTEIDILGENMNTLSSTLETTISELKTANNQLQIDIEKKTEIDEMRKEFLSNVSHELKTPIALIQGYAEGLMECVNDSPESRNSYCEVIIDEAEKMNKLVKQLLSLNQLESGRDNVSMERFNLVELIQGKMLSFERIASNNNIKFTYSGPESIFVWSDVFKVEEVLTNYLTNAFNYVSGHKIIKINAEIIDKVTRVTVYNSGDNIPNEDIALIWDKLYKVDKARTRSYGGNGLGLSIVKAIMDGLNQAYGVENCDNGVKFWFEIDNG